MLWRQIGMSSWVCSYDDLFIWTDNQMSLYVCSHIVLQSTKTSRSFTQTITREHCGLVRKFTHEGEFTHKTMSTEYEKLAVQRYATLRRQRSHVTEEKYSRPAVTTGARDLHAADNSNSSTIGIGYSACWLYISLLAVYLLDGEVTDGCARVAR